jgi:solute carrier family 35
MVSATTFTLVGVVNKFLTVLLNVVIWEKHSSTLGLCAVCICLIAGSAYQQAPRRDDYRKQENDQLVALIPLKTDSAVDLLEKAAKN